MTTPPKTTMLPHLDLRVSRQPAQSLSVLTLMTSWFPPFLNCVIALGCSKRCQAILFNFPQQRLIGFDMHLRTSLVANWMSGRSWAK